MSSHWIFYTTDNLYNFLSKSWQIKDLILLFFCNRLTWQHLPVRFYQTTYCPDIPWYPAHVTWPPRLCQPHSRLWLADSCRPDRPPWWTAAGWWMTTCWWCLGRYRLSRGITSFLLTLFSMWIIRPIFLDRSLMIGWRKNSWNPERVPSVVTLSVCLSVCERATGHTFWLRNLFFGLSDSWDI